MTTRLFTISNQGVKEIFSPLFSSCLEYRNFHKLGPDDCIIFEGGTDVSPNYYGENRGKKTDVSDSTRDAFEKNVFELAVMSGAAMIGVCRGSQFLTVMSGGSLIQHTTGHHRTHFVDTYDDKSLPVTSTHHQMMAPGLVDHELIAWASTNLSDIYLDGNDKDCYAKLDTVFGLEPEIVWYPKTRCLAIQGHPEYVAFHHPFGHYCRELVRKFILKMF